MLGNSLPDSVQSWVRRYWRYIYIYLSRSRSRSWSRSYPLRPWHTKSAFFCTLFFLSPSLDKKQDQTESSNSEGENKGKDNRLLGPSNPESKTRAGERSTCCKTKLWIYPAHFWVFFRMSKTSPISPNPVDPERLGREYRHRTSGRIHF